jgi:hypothetical protein
LLKNVFSHGESLLSYVVGRRLRAIRSVKAQPVEVLINEVGIESVYLASNSYSGKSLRDKSNASGYLLTRQASLSNTAIQKSERRSEKLHAS